MSMRTAALIHRDRLKRNIDRVRTYLPEGGDIIAVLKGDGYGHGLANVYPAFREAGIDKFAVSVWEEGKALRELGAESEMILLLGDTPDEMQKFVVENRLTQTIYDVDAAEKLNEKAEAAGVIQPVHIKLDTGMSRLGFVPEDCLEPVKEIAAMKNLRITGAFTHFMCADDLDDPRTAVQLERFLKAVEMLRANGIDIPMVHVANSPSIMLRPEACAIGPVRGGDVFYGLNPVDNETWAKSGFEEVLTWETVVAMVKTVPAGTDVGYGATYTCCEDTVIATIPVGFADGYSRKLTNKGFAVINGVKAPIIGKVCMDQFMVDATGIEGVERGTRVELLGDKFGILDMADLLDENVDEVVCRISKRVPRIAVD